MASKSFKDVPIGGRIFEYGKTWVVMQNYGDGLIFEYTGKVSLSNSVCSFVDVDSGITLDSKVNFIN